MTGFSVSPQFYGEMWKVSDDEKKCTEIRSPTTEKCEEEVCVTGLSSFNASLLPRFKSDLKSWPAEKILSENSARLRHPRLPETA